MRARAWVGYVLVFGFDLVCVRLESVVCVRMVCNGRVYVWWACVCVCVCVCVYVVGVWRV